MAWKFPLTARELGELSSKISVEIFKQKGIACPEASLIIWRGDGCIKSPAEMNPIAVPIVMEPYRMVWEDEEKRK